MKSAPSQVAIPWHLAVSGAGKKKGVVGVEGEERMTRPMTTSWALVGMARHGTATNWEEVPTQLDEFHI